MGLAVTSVGNHEFDEGIGELMRLTRGGCHVIDGCQDGDGFGGARFQYLAANVVRKRTGLPILPPVAVRTIGGIAIGFIGLTYAGTRQIVSPAVNEEVTFLEEAETINAAFTRSCC
jgi:5'-nucleotidase